MNFGMQFHFTRPAHRSEFEMLSEDLDLMQAAEGLGFSSIWVAEHHFGDHGICPSGALALASVARATKTVRLGTAVVVLPFHSPLRVAEELAFVDVLSGGRLDVGVGRGLRETEFQGFGVKREETRDIFRESLEVITRAWTEDRVTYQGKYFQLRDVEVRPKPYQKPYPRLFVGSISKETFELVGQLGANLLFTPLFRDDDASTTLATYVKQIALYKEAIRAGGGDPAGKEIGALRFIYCADSNEQARRDFEGPMRWFLEDAVEPVPGGVPGESAKHRRSPQFDFGQSLANGSLIAGDPDYVCSRIEEMQQQWQLTTLIAWTRVGDQPPERVMRSMELMGEHVMPHFRVASGADGR